MTPDDLAYRFSNPSASAGNQLAQAVPAASLGGFVSTTDWLGASLEDLFGVLTGDDNFASASEYRCLFIINKHASQSLTGIKMWFTFVDTGGAVVAIGADPTAASLANSGSAQAVVSASAGSAPQGVVFTTPLSKGFGISLGDLTPGQVKAFWVRRTGANTPRKDENTFSIYFEGDA